MTFPKSPDRLAATIALCLLIMTSPVQAQGFFQSLFGGSTPAPQRVNRQPTSLPPYRHSVIPPPPEQRLKSASPSEQPEHGSGHYRTLCVRTCDGYYWPINQTATRGDFHREAKLCQASCGSEAKLFYHSNSSPDVDAMVDLTGRAYARLPNAFRYRKTLVGGCQCKPAPWTETELDRHRHYVELAASAQPTSQPTRGNAGIEVVAGTPTSKRPPVVVASAAVSAAEPKVQAVLSVAAPLETASRPLERQPAEKPLSRAPKTVAVLVRQTPEPQLKRDRLRTVNAPARIAMRSAIKPKAHAAFGLGAGGLKWPGE